MDSTVAVIIPTYNRALYLREAIESVLGQTRGADEVVVVDDGSTDNTSEVCAAFPAVRYIKQANLGLSVARNTGIQASRCDLLAFLDDDDRFLPHALEKQLQAFCQHPEADLVYGRTLLIDLRGRRIGEDLVNHRPPRDVLGSMVVENFIRVQAVMARRQAIERAGGFDPRVKLASDLALWLRLAATGARFVYIPHVLTEYRKHSSAMSADGEQMARSVLQSIELNLAYFPPHRAACFWMANARYRLGRCLLDKGQSELAAPEFRLAVQGRPWSLRYRLYAFWAAHPKELTWCFRWGQAVKRILVRVMVLVGISEQRWGADEFHADSPPSDDKDRLS